jgi:hypothetical protein
METKDLRIRLIEWLCWGFFAMCAMGIGRWAILKAVCYLGWDRPDWAAWVQAVGSVAAIVGAVWLAGDQHRRQKRDRMLGSTLQASICCDGASTTFAEMLQLAGGAEATPNGSHHIKVLLRSFQRHLEEMAAVQMGDLQYSDVVAFAKARQLCKTMEQAFSVLLDSESANVSLPLTVAILKERQPVADKYADQLRNSYALLSA